MEYIFPKINSCCNTMSLETGSRLISIFNTIFLLGSLISQNVDFTLECPRSFLARIQEFIVGSTFTNHTVDCRDIIIAALLVRGVYKRGHHLILPWILLQGTYLLIYLLSFLGYLFDLQTAGFGMDVGFFDANFHFILIVYHYCTVLVVYNFYRELDESACNERKSKLDV